MLFGFYAGIMFFVCSISVCSYALMIFHDFSCLLDSKKNAFNGGFAQVKLRFVSVLLALNRLWARDPMPVSLSVPRFTVACKIF